MIPRVLSNLGTVLRHCSALGLLWTSAPDDKEMKISTAVKKSKNSILKLLWYTKPVSMPVGACKPIKQGVLKSVPRNIAYLQC